MAKNKDNGQLLILIGSLLFIPFLLFTYLHYQKLKKHFQAIPNTQRVLDASLLSSTMVASGIALIAGVYGMLFVNDVIEKNMSPDIAPFIAWPFNLLFGIVLFYILMKLAERIAVRYFGILFNDNDNTMLIPADIANASFGENLRLQFLRRLGDQEAIDIKNITNVTREKGVNFYIHGNFGSRLINYTNKQKRDECLSALKARTKISISRDFGY
ncbi:hypothetical protein MNZ22_01975 [Aeromonas encheleia]|uniref:hypothetical protein n=1 Tax=Aeromonas encheleia TaxID=73010 RepID=UPI001F58ED40|nr:hypothetical protein [Aeromonas encheleia]UNP89267.1 hypothetical protein MNZ22_01975 [Aeromonas encheleia]